MHTPESAFGHRQDMLLAGLRKTVTVTEWLMDRFDLLTIPISTGFGIALSTQVFVGA